jgi:integrase
VSASSVRQCHRVVSLVLAEAVRSKRVRRNVAEGVSLPRVGRKERRFLTADEVARLADAAGGDRLAILLLAYTGVRFGELAGLRVRRVDLMRRRVEIAEAVTEVGGRLLVGTPKTHQRRAVVVPRFLSDGLAEQMAGRGPEDFVFASPEGGPLRLTNWRRRSFDPAVRAAGLDGLTPHGLRHTAASLAVSSGANVKDVQQMLGHASAAMTLDVYAQLFADGLDSVADRLDAIGRAAADSVRTGGSVSRLPAPQERVENVL